MNVGIDYSLRWTAACFYDGKQMSWHLYPVAKTQAAKAMCKRLTDTGLVTVTFAKFSIEGNYTEKERAKVMESAILSDNIVKSALSAAPDENSKKDFYFAFEGVSFNSKGNSLVDTAMSVGVTREKLVRIFGHDRMHVYAPTSVKLFAGKGNYNKVQMRDALLLRPELPQKMREIMSDHSVVNGKGKLQKPIDDIVDACWLSLMLHHELNTTVDA